MRVGVAGPRCATWGNELKQPCTTGAPALGSAVHGPPGAFYCIALYGTLPCSLAPAVLTAPSLLTNTGGMPGCVSCDPLFCRTLHAHIGEVSLCSSAGDLVLLLRFFRFRSQKRALGFLVVSTPFSFCVIKRSTLC